MASAVAAVVSFIGKAATAAAGAASAIGGVTVASTTIGSIFTKAVISFGISTVLGAISRPSNTGGVQSFKKEASGRQVMFRQPITPWRIVYGEQRLSGPITFFSLTGSNNVYLHLVIVLAAHEVEEIGDFYLNDELVALSSTGNDANGIARLEPSTGKYAGFLRVKKHLGDSAQLADADLVSEVTEWTTDHRGRNRAYLYIRFKWDAEVWPQGLPNVKADVKGALVPDPTPGGGGALSYSANSARCLYDYLFNSVYGRVIPDAEIQNDYISTAISVCDENVNLNPSGTEKRYETHGTISLAERPGNVIGKLTAAMAGKAAYISGKWYIQAGAYTAPTEAITEDDLRAGYTLQTKKSKREIFNRVKGTFASPENNYQLSEFPEVTNATYLTEDNNEEIYLDLELPFCASSAQAQRLAKIALEQIRQQIVVKLHCKFTAFRFQAGDTVNLTLSRMGWTNKPFAVLESEPVIGNDGTLGIDLTVKETASTIYSWNSGEETTFDPAPNTSLQDPWTVAAPTSLNLTSELTDPGDGTWVLQLKAAWTAPSDAWVTAGGQIEVQYKETSSGTWIPQAPPAGTTTEMFIAGIKGGVSYDVRVRARNALGVYSSWLTGSYTTAVFSFLNP